MGPLVSSGLSQVTRIDVVDSAVTCRLIGASGTRATTQKLMIIILKMIQYLYRIINKLFTVINNSQGKFDEQNIASLLHGSLQEHWEHSLFPVLSASPLPIYHPIWGTFPTENSDKIF